LEGTGIASATVSTPEISGLPMSSDDGTFFISQDGFSSLANIRAIVGFGTFTIDILGTLGEMDSISVNFDPGNVDLTGYPAISFPTNGATNVPADATLTWSCTGGPCGAGNVDAYSVILSLEATNEDLDVDLIFDPDATSWTHPGSPILENELHNFEVDAVKVFTFEDPQSTTGGDPFLWSSGYTSFNQVQFVPEPRLGLPFALLALWSLKRRSSRT